jgi:hypothetical protein
LQLLYAVGSTNREGKKRHEVSGQIRQNTFAQCHPPTFEKIIIWEGKKRHEVSGQIRQNTFAQCHPPTFEKFIICHPVKRCSIFSIIPSHIDLALNEVPILLNASVTITNKKGERDKLKSTVTP